MDQVERVKKLREEYERALDAAESRRAAYHEAVLALYQGGTPLREIAKELGLSHQRVHQIVSGEQPPRRSKLPRAAGGAAMALILAGATFGALRLAHAPPFSQRATVPSRVNVAYRSRGLIPGGAVLRKKREVVSQATAVGLVSLWVAPDRVSRSARCSWMQLGPNALGGTCYGRSHRGLPQIVPFVSRSWSGPAVPLRLAGWLPVIWGHTGRGVDRVTVAFPDGSHISVASHDGMFLIAPRGLHSHWRSWRSGRRQALLIARDVRGRVVDRRTVRLNPAAPY